MKNTNSDRPLVTFALFAYNQEQYIREAVEGAFSQTYEPLEIILSDDCSTDRTFEIMQEMAAAHAGPHAVTVRRNDQNKGLAVHVNTVMQASSGEIVVLAAGDDISLPHRTKVSVNSLLQNSSAAAVLLSADVIDDAGEIIGERLSVKGKSGEKLQTINDLIKWKHTTFGAARALRRDVFTRFGPLNANCPTEDTPLLLRSLMCGPNVLSSLKVIRYRRHGGNLSGIESLMTMNINEIYRQYQDDLTTALTHELIKDKFARRLNIWFCLDEKIRRLRLKLASNEIRSLRDAVFAIRHPAVGKREKIKFLMAYVGSFRMTST